MTFEVGIRRAIRCPAFLASWRAPASRKARPSCKCLVALSRISCRLARFGAAGACRASRHRSRQARGCVTRVTMPVTIYKDGTMRGRFLARTEGLSIACQGDRGGEVQRWHRSDRATGPPRDQLVRHCFLPWLPDKKGTFQLWFYKKMRAIDLPVLWGHDTRPNSAGRPVGVGRASRQSR